MVSNDVHRGAFGAALSLRSVFAVCYHELKNSRGTIRYHVASSRFGMTDAESCCAVLFHLNFLVPPGFDEFVLFFYCASSCTVLLHFLLCRFVA